MGAGGYADRPLGRLSGGEQQRLRIAQALLGDPDVLLCDEPLLSLDLNHQHATSALIDARRRRDRIAVLFVTHEINPILPMVDRVLYLVGNRWAIGTPDEVMTSQRLSDLYGTEIDVLRVRDRVVVVGVPDAAHGDADGGHHHHAVGDDHEPARATGHAHGPERLPATAAGPARPRSPTTLIAIISGLIGPLVITRRAAFAVHGVAELTLTGAAAGLLWLDNLGPRRPARQSWSWLRRSACSASARTSATRPSASRWRSGWALGVLLLTRTAGQFRHAGDRTSCSVRSSA